MWRADNDTNIEFLSFLSFKPNISIGFQNYSNLVTLEKLNDIIITNSYKFLILKTHNLLLKNHKGGEKNFTKGKFFHFFACIKIFLYVYISISDDKIKANKAKTIPECQFTRLVSHQRHMDEKTKEIIRSLLYNQWQQRSSDQQLLPTLTRCIRKRKKKLTLVNQDCLIPTASFLKLDSHSRVSPTHTNISYCFWARDPKSLHVNPGNICPRSESDQITARKLTSTSKSQELCYFVTTSHKKMKFFFPRLSMVVHVLHYVYEFIESWPGSLRVFRLLLTPITPSC